MYLFSKEFNEQFIGFMNNLVAQTVFGSITMVLAFRSSTQLLNYKTLTMIVLSWILFVFLIYWCFCSFTQLLSPLNKELEERLKSVGRSMVTGRGLCLELLRARDKIILSWRYDRGIFWQAFIMFLIIEIPSVFLIFASILGATQIFNAMNW